MIRINENYQIKADATSYILQEKKIRKDKNGQDEEVWENMTYHTKLENALVSCRRNALKKSLTASDAVKLDEVITKIAEIDKSFIEALTDLVEQLEV